MTTASDLPESEKPGAQLDEPVSMFPEPSGPAIEVAGPARADRRTKDLIARLTPGDIAVINHRDLDTVAAESLVSRRVAAVVNAAESSSGRYPNEGPLIVLRAGIPLIDGVGAHVLSVVEEGQELRVEGDGVWLGDELVARGTPQNEQSILATHMAAREALPAELERFVNNTVEYIEHNRDLIDGSAEIPDLGIDFRGRHALVVVRGASYKDDLRMLRQTGYFRDIRPVVIGVDGGADALLELGVTPDVIVGDMDSVSETALRCGAQLVVHAYRDGRAPGAERLVEMGVPHHLFKISGTSEDIAMLLAYDGECDLIVAVGTHTSMVDFLDKGRSGMASTVLTRMLVGEILVDVKGLSRLYRNPLRKRDLLMLVVAALVVVAVVIGVSDSVQLIIRSYWVEFTS